MQRYPGGAEPPGLCREAFKEGEAGQGGLPALECEAGRAVGVHKAEYVFQQRPHDAVRHDPRALFTAVVGDVLIKAVAAAQVAEAGGRFDQ